MALAPLDRLEAALKRASLATERLASPDPGVRALVEAVAEAVRELDALLGEGKAGHG